MEKETKHTPEWRWILNESSKTVRLESTASGRDTIMDFVRYGMHWAQPRFNVDGIMIKAEELGEIVEGREHHAEWFKFINHPIAQLIASAPSLQSEIDRLKEALSAVRHCTYDRDTDDGILSNICDILTENGFPYKSED